VAFRLALIWLLVLVIVFLAATLARMLKLSLLLCVSAAVFLILRRNHPNETPSTEEGCSWLNHGLIPTKGFDGPLISKALILKEIESNLRFNPSELSQKVFQ
jgi:hypothetical protein